MPVSPQPAGLGLRWSTSATSPQHVKKDGASSIIAKAPGLHSCDRCADCSKPAHQVEALVQKGNSVLQPQAALRPVGRAHAVTWSRWQGPCSFQPALASPRPCQAAHPLLRYDRGYLRWPGTRSAGNNALALAPKAHTPSPAQNGASCLFNTPLLSSVCPPGPTRLGLPAIALGDLNGGLTPPGGCWSLGHGQGPLCAATRLARAAATLGRLWSRGLGSGAWPAGGGPEVGGPRGARAQALRCGDAGGLAGGRGARGQAAGRPAAGRGRGGARGGPRAAGRGGAGLGAAPGPVTARRVGTSRGGAGRGRT